VPFPYVTDPFSPHGPIWINTNALDREKMGHLSPIAFSATCSVTCSALPLSGNEGILIKVARGPMVDEAALPSR
jgi:hypothetical protein